MPFDLNILCIMEKTPTEALPFKSAFYFERLNKKQHSFPKGFGWDARWAFMSSCYGYWYYLLPTKNRNTEFPGLSGCYDCCTAAYKQEYLDSKEYPTFEKMYDEWEYHRKVALASLTMKPKYRKAIEKVIDYFIERSAIKMLIFLPRYQGSERDNVEGVLWRDLFFEMLDSGKINFNTCYIIGDNSVGPDDE